MAHYEPIATAGTEVSGRQLGQSQNSIINVRMKAEEGLLERCSNDLVGFQMDYAGKNFIFVYVRIKQTLG